MYGFSIWLFKLNKMFLIFIHVVGLSFIYFIAESHFIEYWTMICLLIHLLMDIWVISSSWAL